MEFAQAFNDERNAPNAGCPLLHAAGQTPTRFSFVQLIAAQMRANDLKLVGAIVNRQSCRGSLADVWGAAHNGGASQ